MTRLLPMFVLFTYSWEEEKQVQGRVIAPIEHIIYTEYRVSVLRFVCLFVHMGGIFSPRRIHSVKPTKEERY